MNRNVALVFVMILMAWFDWMSSSRTETNRDGNVTATPVKEPSMRRNRG